MNSYCVKCRDVTPTTNVNVVRAKNGRYQTKGVCTRCHSKKCSFISSAVGKGLLGKALGIGKIPILGDIPLLGALF